MTNDITTLNGALTELGETLAENLETMGVTASASDGLSTLANAVLDIEQGGGGQEIVSFDNMTTEFNYTRKRDNYGFRVTIPNGITKLGNYCFYNCSGLTTVVIPNSVTELGNYCFYNCNGLTSITIPSGVTKLGINCFYSCTDLTSITIPSGVTKLGNYCFRTCTSLTSITIPSGVTSIGNMSFSDCTSLTSITIPSGVTSIGSSCFYGCTNLNDYQLYWETPPVTWSSTLMPNKTNTYFTIPNGTTANYVAKSFPSDKLIERSV